MSRQINYEGPTHGSGGSVLKDRRGFFLSRTANCVSSSRSANCNSRSSEARDDHTIAEGSYINYRHHSINSPKDLTTHYPKSCRYKDPSLWSSKESTSAIQHQKARVEFSEAAMSSFTLSLFNSLASHDHPNLLRKCLSRKKISQSPVYATDVSSGHPACQQCAQWPGSHLARLA